MAGVEKVELTLVHDGVVSVKHFHYACHCILCVIRILYGSTRYLSLSHTSPHAIDCEFCVAKTASDWAGSKAVLFPFSTLIARLAHTYCLQDRRNSRASRSRPHGRLEKTKAAVETSWAYLIGWRPWLRRCAFLNIANYSQYFA